MWNDDDRKWLYEKMKSNGIDTGSYDDFTNSLNNQEDRDWYYQKSVDMGLDVGSADDFTKMMVEPQESAQPQAQTTVQPAEGQAPSDAVRAEYADTIMGDGEIVPGEKMETAQPDEAYNERMRGYQAGAEIGAKAASTTVANAKKNAPKEAPLQTAEPTQVQPQAQEETPQAPQSAQETQTNYEPSGTPWLKEEEPKPWENTPWNTRNVGDNKAVNEEWKAARQEQTATTQQLVSGTSSADAWKQNATAMRRMDNAEFQRRVRGEEFDNTDNNFETFYQTSVAPTFKTERAKADVEGNKAAAQYPSVTASNGMTVPNVMAAAAYEKATDPAVVTQNVLANLDGNALSQYVERRMHVDEQPMMGGIERQLTDEELNLVRDLIAAENGDVVTKLQQRMYQDYINEGGNMTTAGYILGNGFRNSLLMRLQDAIVTRIAGSSGLRKQFLDMAYQRAGERAGAIARGVSGAVTMIADAPAFGVAGKAAAPVARGVIGTVGKALAGRTAGELSAAAAERFIVANSRLGRVAENMLQSGLTFSGYDVMSEGVNQFQQGQFDAGELVNRAIKGFGTGAAVGVLGGATGELTKELTGVAKGVGKAYGFAAEVGLFTGMQGLEMAAELGIPITDVDWGALTIENAAMLGVLKLQSMPFRARMAKDVDLALNDYDIEELRRRGYDFGTVTEGLNSLKSINSGGEVNYTDKSGKPYSAGEQRKVNAMYAKLLADKDLPIDVKRKVRFYLEGEFTPYEPVFGMSEVRVNEDGTAMLETYSADGSVISRERFNSAQEVEGRKAELMDQVAVNQLSAYMKLAEHPLSNIHKMANMEAKGKGNAERERLLDIIDRASRGEELTQEEADTYLELYWNAGDYGKKTSADIFNGVAKNVKGRTGIDVQRLLADKTRKAVDWTPEEREAVHTYLDEIGRTLEFRGAFAEMQLRGSQEGAKVRIEGVPEEPIDEGIAPQDGGGVPPETVEQAGAEYNNALQNLLALDGGTEMRNRIDGLLNVENSIDEEFVSEFIGSYGALGEELYNACMDYAKAEAKRRAVEAKAQEAADDIQKGYGETFEPAVNEDGRLTMGVYDGQSVVIKNWDNESDLVKILDAGQNETTVRKADIENINLGMPFDEWVRMNTAGRVQTIFNNVNIAYQPQESVGGGLGMPQGVNGEGGAKPAEDGGPTDFPQGEIPPTGDNSPTPPTEPENIAPTEPTQPRTEGGMPLYEEGGKLKPDFKNATSEETYNYLYGERKMNRDDINAFVRNKVSDAEKRLKKLEGKRPKMGTDLDEFEDKVNKWEQDKTDTQKELDYWNDVQQRAKQENLDEQRENADLAAQWKKVAALDDAVSLHEYLMRQVYGGLKFIWENNENGTKGLGAHLGLGDGSEKRSRRWMIGKQENGAMYPEKAAEVLAERYSADTGNEVEYDEVFNTLLDILRGYDKKSVLGNDILKEHEAGQFNEDTFNKEDEKRSKDAWAVEQGFTDFAAYEDYMKSLEGTERPEGEDNGNPPVLTDELGTQEPQAKEEPATPTEPAAEPQGTVEETPKVEQPTEPKEEKKEKPSISKEGWNGYKVGDTFDWQFDDGTKEKVQIVAFDRSNSQDGTPEIVLRHYDEQGNLTGTEAYPPLAFDEEVKRQKALQKPAEPKGTFNPIEEAKKNVEEKEKKGTGKTSANGEKKEDVSATDKVVKDFMDAYHAWSQNVLGKGKRDDTLYRTYAAEKARLHEVMRSMSDEELAELGKQNAVVNEEVKEEQGRRRNNAIAEGVFTEGIKQQGEIVGKAKAPKIVADDFAEHNEVKLMLNGVYHDEEGFGVASDGFVLIADKNLFDDKHKGKTVLTHKTSENAKGDEIEGKYPLWRMLLGNTDGKVKATVEWDGLRNFLAGAENVLKERWKAEKDRNDTKSSFKSWSEDAVVLLKMPDGSLGMYRYNQLRSFADAAADMGMKDIYYSVANDITLEASNTRGALLLQPKQINGSDLVDDYWLADKRLYFDWSDKNGVSQQKVEGETTESKADGKVVLLREGNGKIEATPDLGYTKKQAERYREREQKRMRGHVAEMAEKMHMTDKVVVHDTAEGLKGRYATAKGWYDNKTGKIHVVIDNNRNIFDVMMTMMHEGVAHYGLRQMCGEHFDAFLDDVFANADESIKSAIRDKMDSMRNKDKNKKSEEAYRRAATEEYMADVAEQMEFSDAPPATFKSWWSKIKDLFLEMWGKLGLGKYFGPTITDNEIRYILWRSYQNLVNPGRYKNPFAVEEERAKAEERIEPKAEPKVEAPKVETNENVLVAADTTRGEGSNGTAKGFISTTQGDDYTFEQKSKMLEAYRMIKENYNAIALLNTPTGYVLINDGAKAARKVFGLDNSPYVVVDKEGLDEVLPRMIRAGYRLAIADVMTDNKVSEDDVDVFYNNEAEETDKEYSDAVKERDYDKVEQILADAAKVAMPDTKVVDENGNPKVVYHGSKLAEFYYKDGNPYTRWIDRFTVFNEGKGYFTDKERDAKNVGSGNRGLYKCYLNITKPFVFDAKGARWDDIEFNGQKYRTTDSVVRWAREQGEYDGVIIKNVIEPETQNPKPITDYVAFSPNQIKSAVAEYDDNGNLIPLSEKFNEEEDDIRFRDGEEEVGDADSGVRMRLVEDKEEVDRLEAEPKSEGYRNVVLNDDLSLGSPMAGKLGKKGTGRKATSTFNFNKWERSDEHPELATDDGKINLIKPGGKGEVGGVDYNPYIHIRPTLVNKQFKQAWERPDLVYVKTLYPTSELEGGYHAEKAKLSVGKHPWSGGTELILSRWDKPVEIVRWDKVADDWAEEFKDRGAEFDIVPPGLLPYLVERGIEILPPHKGMGAACEKAYADFKNGNYHPDAISNERIDELNKRIEYGGRTDTDQKRTTAEQLASKLGVKVNIVDDVNAITHGNARQQERRRNAKGWYNTATGEVTIVLPNNRNVDDVVATTLHEVVAHKGLREMVGEERYNEFLDEIYSHLKKDLKEKVDKMAFDMFMNGLGKSKDTTQEHRRVAVDELLGKLAEKGFEDFTEGEKSIWQKLKEAVLKVLNKFLDTLKLPKWFTLGDNELRYILWRSKERMERGKENPIDMAKDNIKRRELGLNDGDLYSSTETDDIWNDNSLSMSEKIASVKVRLAQNQRDNKTLRNEALQQLGTSLSDLRKAMRLQRDFDQSTVKRVSDLARIMMKGGYLRGLGASDFDSILAAVKNSVGHDNVEGSVQKLLDLMIDNQLKNAERVLKALETIKGKKVNESGVEVMGELDPRGQRMMEVFKKVRRWKPEDIENAINSALDRMGSDDNAVAEEAANEYAGLMLAQNYVDTIIASEVEEAELRKEIKETHDNASESDRRTPAYRDLIRSLNDAIRENKIERAEAYIDLAQRMSADLKQSIENAKDFKEAEKMRVNEIHHNANSDMEGRPAKIHRKVKPIDRLANSWIARKFLAPLNTFFEMLRMFGGKSADGEGYLFNRFGRGWVDCRTKEISGVRKKFGILDNKAKELFGGKVKNMAGLIRYAKKLPGLTVVVKNGGENEEFTMLQNELLYLYMVNKMLDGKMKLRKMGISEADIETLADKLDPKLIAWADWVQDEFLVDCRNEYNETHKRVFGASMAAIENYFPLKILKDDLDVKPDDLDKPAFDGISTVVSAIKKRNRNTKALDILHADAFSTLLEHVATMEHWNAFVEFNRDLNTLRTYKRFRNQVKNMTTVYGSGSKLWRNFNDVCKIAVGSYEARKDDAEGATVNLAKSYTASRIVLMPYTAVKQLESLLAYIPYARTDYLLADMVNPKKAWDWTMENLPILEERWRSRIAGDPRLLKTDVDWAMWRTNLAQIAQRIGMTPNAFMDFVAVSIGAHSIYKTRYGHYIKAGYSEEEAEHRAIQDAVIIPNETQQSSESAFLSPMQVDKTYFNVLYTIFRNASMGYQRRLHNAYRNMKHNLVTIGKDRSIEFMTKQYVRDGIDATQAEAKAQKKFSRQLLRDMLTIATFGYIVQYGWNLIKVLPYILFGDDEEEKEKLWNDVFAQATAAQLEGLTGGDIMSEGIKQIITGEGYPESADKEMPIDKAILDVWKKYRHKKGDEALSDIINIVVATSIGLDPHTITDTVLAIMDACGDDPALAHEATLFAFRVLQVPQSQIDKLYFDEVGLSGEEASKYSMEELAERYARYKVKRGRFFTPWAWYDKEALGKAKKKAQKAIKERVDRLGSKEQNDKYAEYEEKYKAIADEVKAAKEVGEKNKKKGDAMLDALYNDKEKKGLYDTFKKLDKGLDDLAKRYLKAINENEAELYHNAIEEYKQLAVKVLESPDSISREKNEKELKALLDRVFKEMKEIEE